MTRDDDRSDLPALREETRDLPVLIPGSKPHHERAPAILFPTWSNLASQRHVRSLALSSQTGDLWLATTGGVLHWQPNLKTFTRYGSEHGLAGNITTVLAIDGHGLVWVAHEHGGLSYLDGIVWRPYVPLEGKAVSCLSTDDTGRLWVGTTEGIYTVADPSDDPLTELPFTGDPPRSLAINGNGDVWFCNARGLLHYQEGKCILSIAQTGILMMASCNHHLWLGTIGGLVLMDLATTKVSRVDTWPTGEITALAPAPDGIWAACGGQVGLATTAGWTPFVRGQRLPTRITALASNNEDEVWIGTHEGLVYATAADMRLHLTDTPPDVIGHSSTDPHMPPVALGNLIQALAIQERAQGSLVWIGTPSGLFCLDPSTENWKRYGQHGLRDIRALATSTDGNALWAASWSGGVYNVKERAIVELSAETCGPLLTLDVGPDSTCWAAGPHGLYRRKAESSWTCVLSEHALPSSGWIRAISQSSPTRVWVGTTDGLFSYHLSTQALLPMSGTPLGKADIRALLSFVHKQSEYLWVGINSGLYYGPASTLQQLPDLTGHIITSLLWDGRGCIVWVGTNKGLFGLTQKDKDTWVIASELTSGNSGLANDHVTALALDSNEHGKKRLWIGTPCGLSCYIY